MKTVDLNTSPALPESSGGVEGATSNSMGDASMADLKKGFYKCVDESSGERDSLTPPVSDERAGFLDRPQGWER